MAMDIDFPTFAALLLGACILLAFLELALKSTPMDKPDFASDYELPPNVEKIHMVKGEWRHKDDGRLATKAEVKTAGLIWPATPPSSPGGGSGRAVTGSGIANKKDD